MSKNCEIEDYFENEFDEEYIVVYETPYVITRRTEYEQQYLVDDDEFEFYN